jgi:hypothetical protein
VGKTSKADFTLFKAEFARCARRWGIVGWGISYVHEPTNPRARGAELRTRVLSRVAVAVLFVDWDKDPVTRKAIITTARHEATHLLLSPLADVVSSRYLTEDEEMHANESVCRHVEGLLP